MIVQKQVLRDEVVETKPTWQSIVDGISNKIDGPKQKRDETEKIVQERGQSSARDSLHKGSGDCEGDETKKIAQKQQLDEAKKMILGQNQDPIEAKTMSYRRKPKVVETKPKCPFIVDGVNRTKGQKQERDEIKKIAVQKQEQPSTARDSHQVESRKCDRDGIKKIGQKQLDERKKMAQKIAVNGTKKTVQKQELRETKKIKQRQHVDETKTIRQKQREAARIQLEQIKNTAGFSDNMDAMIDFYKLIFNETL
ncbi:uncharacterized protein G2W53_029762 [Senna tora]|uniref:Uncharacterized protein n=1 Tax=Senna tora TaxID=362788 RepID=A0A834WC83_9FABA|nr:uncharacterized protein G2W53_029762 [Senna tora]